MVPLRPLPLVVLALALAPLLPAAGQTQPSGTVLGPERNTLYPDATDEDPNNPGVEGYILSTSQAAAGLISVFGADVTYELVPPLAVGLVFNETGQVVVTWVVESVQGAMLTVRAELFADETSLGSAEQTQDAVGGQPATYTLSFTPNGTVDLGRNLRLAITAQGALPDVGLTHDLPSCQVALPILLAIGGAGEPEDNNTTRPDGDEDTPAPGFVFAGLAFVAAAAWASRRR